MAPVRPLAMQNFYQDTLIWQKATMSAAGSNITKIIHLYCKFLAEQEIHLCRANVALMTLHPQIEAIRFVWHNTVITVDREDLLADSPADVPLFEQEAKPRSHSITSDSSL